MLSDISLDIANYIVPYSVILPKTEVCVKKEAENLEKNMCWYTEQFKTDEGVGLSILRLSSRAECSFSLSDLTTIFQVEVYAIETYAKLIWKQQFIREMILKNCH